jgi:hypothetical protein
VGLSDRTKIDAAKAHLRREYSDNAEGLAALKQLARDAFSEATDTVTLTSTSFEGGAGSGQITFDKMILLVALNELIAERDSTYVAPTATPGTGRPLGVTVRLGH